MKKDKTLFDKRMWSGYEITPYDTFEDGDEFGEVVYLENDVREAVKELKEEIKKTYNVTEEKYQESKMAKIINKVFRKLAEEDLK